MRILDENLQAIDRAIAQCREALKTDPANVYLNGHLSSSRGRKLDLLRRDPSRIPGAVEEMLRYFPAFAYMRRS